jgi:hypothetical protein
MGLCGCLGLWQPDDRVDAEEQLSEQLESLPYLVRFQYDKSRCAARFVAHSCAALRAGCEQ